MDLKDFSSNNQYIAIVLHLQTTTDACQDHSLHIMLHRLPITTVRAWLFFKGAVLPGPGDQLSPGRITWLGLFTRDVGV